MKQLILSYASISLVIWPRSSNGLGRI